MKIVKVGVTKIGKRLKKTARIKRFIRPAHEMDDPREAFRFATAGL